MASRYGGIPPNQFKDPKSFYSAVPANSQNLSGPSPLHTFSITRLEQTPIMEALTKEDEGYFKHLGDVSLAKAISPIKTCVGFVCDGEGQLGSCTLIASNLALVACHSLEGISDVRNVRVRFGFGENLECRDYKILDITEYNQDLDYAVIRLNGAPGEIYPFPKLAKNVYQEPSVLLHHPRSKSLQISVHASVCTGLGGDHLSTYHDSHYGSSGAGYIDPQGRLFAMHLGSKRNFDNFNVERLALPLSTIAERVPVGIISRILQNKLPQNHTYAESQAGAPTYYIPNRSRNFILDLEKWDKVQMVQGDPGQINYKLETDPPVLIEWYQKKHSSCWPANWKGKKGSDFYLALDDTVDLLEIVANNCPLFIANPPEDQWKPSKKAWDIDKSVFQAAGRIDLYKHLTKSLKINTLYVYAGYSGPLKMWEMHVYPE